MMNSQEIETAVRLDLDILIIVINDNGLGMIKWKQGNLGLDAFGLDHGNPDFVKYAESFGAIAVRIESLDQFSKKVFEFINKKGVCLIEVPVDYSENLALSDELKKKTCVI